MTSDSLSLGNAGVGTEAVEEEEVGLKQSESKSNSVDDKSPSASQSGQRSKTRRTEYRIVVDDRFEVCVVLQESCVSIQPCQTLGIRFLCHRNRVNDRSQSREIHDVR